MEGYQAADLVVTGIIVAAFFGSIATVWAWAQSGVVWPWSKPRPQLTPHDVEQLTEALHELHARLEGVQDDLAALHDRVDRTERLLAPAAEPKPRTPPSP